MMSPSEQHPTTSNQALVGPFTRADKQHLDETKIILDLFRDQKDGVMIDVGAHHGYACEGFVEKGWDIYAFEPDPNNRKVLSTRLGNKSNVEIFSNAVSDTSGQTLPFYASDESTGISGLSAFTEGHRKICQAETITLIGLRLDVCHQGGALLQRRR